MKKHSVSISDYSDPDVIAALTAELERHNVAALDIQTVDGHIAIGVHASSDATGARSPTATAAPRSPAVLAHAPIAGHFLPEHPLRPASAVNAGTPLEKGQIAGFVKIGPVLVVVACGKKGVAGSYSVEPGSLVGFGDPIIKDRA